MLRVDYCTWRHLLLVLFIGLLFIVCVFVSWFVCSLFACQLCCLCFLFLCLLASCKHDLTLMFALDTVFCLLLDWFLNGRAKSEQLRSKEQSIEDHAQSLEFWGVGGGNFVCGLPGGPNFVVTVAWW